MCYAVYLSTDSQHDLAQDHTDLILFERISVAEPLRSMLLHDHKWYVGSRSECSCTFRHLQSVELGFGESVEWFPEEEDEIAATLQFIQIIRKIIQWGHKVDCIDVWEGATRDDIQVLNVNLGEIKDNQFRFFENHHFLFQQVN